MSKNVGYDRIAFSYDFVAGFFSLNQINKSQIAFLSHLSDRSTCLILGGGTGYFLQKLLEIHTSIHVTYVDASSKMIDAARHRIQKEIPYALDQITFVCKEVDHFEWQNYDVIVCNYFLDLFNDENVRLHAEKFKEHLNHKGFVYITDFHIKKTNGLVRCGTLCGLKILYGIHKCITKLDTTKLPEIEMIMQQQCFSIQYSKDYLKGILQCRLYKKND